MPSDAAAIHFSLLTSTRRRLPSPATALTPSGSRACCSTLDLSLFFAALSLIFPLFVGFRFAPSEALNPSAVDAVASTEPASHRLRPASECVLRWPSLLIQVETAADLGMLLNPSRGDLVLRVPAGDGGDLPRGAVLRDGGGDAVAGGDGGHGVRQRGDGGGRRVLRFEKGERDDLRPREGGVLNGRDGFPDHVAHRRDMHDGVAGTQRRQRGGGL